MKMNTPALYPLFARLVGRKVLVVGGGAVAERKVRALLSAGAVVQIGAPALTRQLAAWADAGAINWYEGSFEAAWLEDVWLVLAATDSAVVNEAVRFEADKRRLWTNVVDDPELSLFHVPAVVDRSPLTIAISSGGAAPMVARRVRERIESLFDHSLGQLTALLACNRERIVAAYPDLNARRDFYDRICDDSLEGLFRQGRDEEAEALLHSHLRSPARLETKKRITLLYCPPAQPGSMTLDGLRALNLADVLVAAAGEESAPLLDLARRDAERCVLEAGAWRQPCAVASELADLLRRHRRVVVLVPSEELVAPVMAACRSIHNKDLDLERLDAGRRA